MMALKLVTPAQFYCKVQHLNFVNLGLGRRGVVIKAFAINNRLNMFDEDCAYDLERSAVESASAPRLDWQR